MFQPGDEGGDASAPGVDAPVDHTCLHPQQQSTPVPLLPANFNALNQPTFHVGVTSGFPVPNMTSGSVRPTSGSGQVFPGFSQAPSGFSDIHQDMRPPSLSTQIIERHTSGQEGFRATHPLPSVPVTVGAVADRPISSTGVVSASIAQELQSFKSQMVQMFADLASAHSFTPACVQPSVMPSAQTS